jgi:flagellar hook-basal body complex protein FliE
MSVNSIANLSINDLVDSVSQSSPASAPFSDQLLNELNAVNTKLTNAETTLQDFTAGKTDNIHHVMLALEDAKLSFQLLVQVRNKVLEGYQDVLRMQI